MAKCRGRLQSSLPRSIEFKLRRSKRVVWHYSDCDLKVFENHRTFRQDAQSLSIYYENHDGFRRQLLTVSAIRARFLVDSRQTLVQPSDSSSIMLTGFYSTRKTARRSRIPWTASIARSEAPQTIAGAYPTLDHAATFVRITTRRHSGGSVDLGIGS